MEGYLRWALSAQSERGLVAYQQLNCGSCHGQKGDAPTSDSYPIIARQNPTYTYNQLLQIRDGQRSNGSSLFMKEAIQEMSDDQARDIAEFLASAQ